MSFLISWTTCQICCLVLLGIKTVEIRGFLGFLVIIGSNRAQKHVIGTPVCPKMFTGNVPVLLMPNDKPQWARRLAASRWRHMFCLFPSSALIFINFIPHWRVQIWENWIGPLKRISQLSTTLSLGKIVQRLDTFSFALYRRWTIFPNVVIGELVKRELWSNRGSVVVIHLFWLIVSV